VLAFRAMGRLFPWLESVSEDFETHTEFAVTHLYVPMIELMTRRIARD
jgi:hypothetical protein